jgi:hypothetical protein
MITYHKWEANNKRYRAVYDEDYQTRGSYALNTEEETKAAEDEETANLESGKWVALGIIVFERKPHCSTCTCKEPLPWTETDSLWGIVIENNTATVEVFARDSM